MLVLVLVPVPEPVPVFVPVPVAGACALVPAACCLLPAAWWSNSHNLKFGKQTPLNHMQNQGFHVGILIEQKEQKE